MAPRRDSKYAEIGLAQSSGERRLGETNMELKTYMHRRASLRPSMIVSARGRSESDKLSR